jgi:hypothetical protein
MSQKHTSTEPGFASIKLPKPHEYFSSLCCPKCGNAQMTGDPPYIDEPCPHLIFVWWDFAGNFFYQSDELEARRANRDGGDTHEDWQDPTPEWLASLGYGPSVLMLAVHEENVGAGQTYAVWAWDLAVE